MVFGSFDVLHEGHRFLFSEARKYGDYVVVVVARDKRYQQLKSKNPVYTEMQRVEYVQREKDVDKALLGSDVDVYKVIEDEKPDVICLGYDQKHYVDKLAEKIKEFGLKIEIVRIASYKPDVYKSSLIKAKQGLE